MRRSYCGRCKWFKEMGVAFNTYRKCFHPENSYEARDPISEWECHPLCDSANPRNRCKLFEPNWMERVKRFFNR